MDDVSTMRPAALFFKWGRAALMLNSIPLRFVANTSSQALSLISSNFTGGKMPAFAQRMSTPPNSAATVAMTSSISPCSLTSPRQNITVLPRPRRASTVAAPSGSFRPSKQTRAADVIGVSLEPMIVVLGSIELAPRKAASIVGDNGVVRRKVIRHHFEDVCLAIGPGDHGNGRTGAVGLIF